LDFSGGSAGRQSRLASHTSMTVHSVYEVFSRHFRLKRMTQFVELFKVTSQTRILDVGGHIGIWAHLSFSPKLTLLNLSPARTGTVNIRCVVGDARTAPFERDAFDVVFSNSVIEHLRTWEHQRSFAREIARLGGGYYVQTPNRWFPVEPHLLTPFIHFLPKIWAIHLLRNCTLWGLIARPSRQQCQDFLDEVRLLSEREMEVLFPDATILQERFLGMKKSLIAVRLRK